jgi:hypothetical protein
LVSIPAAAGLSDRDRQQLQSLLKPYSIFVRQAIDRRGGHLCPHRVRAAAQGAGSRAGAQRRRLGQVERALRTIEEAL